MYTEKKCIWSLKCNHKLPPLFYWTCRRIGKIVVQIQTTLPIIHCERKSPHLHRVELVNVGTFVGCCGSGVILVWQEREAASAQGLKTEVSNSVSVAVSEADSRAINDLYESKQQGTERNVRDCFSLEQREARLVHRNAENIHQGERMRMVRRCRNQTKWKRCSVAAAFHIARTNVRVENR